MLSIASEPPNSLSNAKMQGFTKSSSSPSRAIFLRARQKSSSGGVASDPYVIYDEVFQGTVLGPPLWNVLFSDVCESVPPGFTEAKFADDLNLFKLYEGKTDVAALNVTLKINQCSASD